MKNKIVKTLNILCFASIASLAISTNVSASTGVGNGGDAIVCADKPTILLDSYEARFNGLTLSLDNPNVAVQTLRSLVATPIERLSLRDEFTARKLWKYSMEMVSDFESFSVFGTSDGVYRGQVIHMSPDLVGEISDSLHRSIPEGCELRQLVSQINPQRLRENRYVINSTLWNQLSLEDQAMTILHEAWYRIMIEDGAKDSRGTRYMNGLVASKEFDQYSFSDYIKELKTTEKKHYVLKNNSTLIFDKDFKVNLKDNFKFNGEEVCTKNLRVRANIKKLGFIGSLHFGLAKTNFTNVCFNNSVIKSLTLPEKLAKKRINFVMEKYLIRTNRLLEEQATIHFNPNGTFKELTGLQYEMLYKMYYKCKTKLGRYISWEREKNCKGPYLDYSTKVKKPESILFDSNEKPIGYFE